MSQGAQQRHQELKSLDEAQVTALHWKIMFVSGMGFFTDAYDLFIIGVAMALIKDQWKPSPLEVSLVTSTALLASVIGALMFGRVADVLGRKRIYGIEVLVLAAGAVATALAPNIIWLIIFRFILGVGIGGDYPVSATIMSEYAGKRSRGMLVSMVFAMQAAGLIVGPLVAAGLLRGGISHNLAWRLMLGLGALPALAVYWMRRHIKETPRYNLAHGRQIQADESGEETGSHKQSGNKHQSSSEARKDTMWQGWSALTNDRRTLIYLVGASLTWFLMDFAYYGNTVSSPLILKAIDPNKTLLKDTLLQLLIFGVAAAPGYFVAAMTMDRIGRKLIQTAGFAVMGVCFGVIAFYPDLQKMLWPFLAVYGISYFFTEFGPNATTFIYPSELFPVRVRTTGHGIASAAGKLGAFVGVFCFPLLMHHHGLSGAELAAAIVSMLGLVATLILLPETKGKSLEEITGDHFADEPQPADESSDRDGHGQTSSRSSGTARNPPDPSHSAQRFGHDLAADAKADDQVRRDVAVGGRGNPQ